MVKIQNRFLIKILKWSLNLFIQCLLATVWKFSWKNWCLISMIVKKCKRFHILFTYNLQSLYLNGLSFVFDVALMRFHLINFYTVSCIGQYLKCCGLRVTLDFSCLRQMIASCMRKMENATWWLYKTANWFTTVSNALILLFPIYQKGNM